MWVEGNPCWKPSRGRSSLMRAESRSNIAKYRWSRPLMVPAGQQSLLWLNGINLSRDPSTVLDSRTIRLVGQVKTADFNSTMMSPFWITLIWR